jgi:hypothetical protein
MSFYEKDMHKELVRIREVLALQTTLMGFNTLKSIDRLDAGYAGEGEAGDEAWLLEIITKAETMAFPEKLRFD